MSTPHTLRQLAHAPVIAPDVDTCNPPFSSPLLELANYHVLGRVFYYVPYCAPLPPNKVLSTFGLLMVLVETLNALGVALASNSSASSGQQSLGGNLILAALATQLFVIIIFIGLAGLFHRRCATTKIPSSAVNTMLATLYASMTLILVRCIYRMVEHAGDTKIDLVDLDALRSLSPLLRYEAYFYVFEASLMLVNSVLWNVWHPGRFLPLDHHIYLARDGTEMQREEDMDRRPLLAKTANILTFGLLFRRKEQTQQFQELSEYPAANVSK